MKYTFEFSIAGCSTNCAHCYVDGGPAPQMKLEDYKYCAQRIKPILDRINGDIAVTLGNEIFCHSAINEILKFNATYLPKYFSFRNYPVPTTGIALIDRKDKDQILYNLHTVGASGCMLAVHGTEQSHDRTVSRHNAYSKLFETADFFAKNEFGIRFNLIVSKTLCTSFNQLMQKIFTYPHADIVLTVPLYVPTNRMRMYQYNRAEFDDCIQLANMAAEYPIDTARLLEHGYKHNEDAVLAELSKNGFNYATEKQKVVQWKFFNITRNGDLYLGNVGAHTKLLGNLFYTEDNKLLKDILSSEPNYDYSAYFSDNVFLSLEKQLSRLPPRTHNYVYASKQDCIYALLNEIGIPSNLI